MASVEPSLPYWMAALCSRDLEGGNKGSSIYNTLTVRATGPIPGRHGATAEQRHVRVLGTRLMIR